MVKIIVEIKENNKTNNSTITIKKPNIEKSSKNEQITTTVVYNTICKSIEDLKKEN